MDARQVGFAIAVVGVLVVVGGLLVATGWFAWVGRLPGDIRWESGGTRVYVPITTMILASVVLSLAMYVARRVL